MNYRQKNYIIPKSTINSDPIISIAYIFYSDPIFFVTVSNLHKLEFLKVSIASNRRIDSNNTIQTCGKGLLGLKSHIDSSLNNKRSKVIMEW